MRWVGAAFFNRDTAATETHQLIHVQSCTNHTAEMKVMSPLLDTSTGSGTEVCWRMTVLRQSSCDSS